MKPSNASQGHTSKEASALEQLNMMRSLIETDQKTVDAIGARLAVISDSLKHLARQLAKRNAEQLTAEKKEG